jgi:diguanylate cyclase (GGDEF)-like protein
MKLYTVLSALRWPRTYLGKILLAAFLCVYLPLVSLSVWLVVILTQRMSLTTRVVLILTLLVLTAVSFVLVRLAMRSLTEPLRRTAVELERYRENGKPPELPTKFRDELGSIMREIQGTTNELESLLSEAQRASLLDALTNVLNRNGGEQRLREELARASRTGQPLSVAIIDLDKLKTVNDRWGHRVGDRFIAAVAAALQSGLREGDWVARWGGDEFVVALNSTHIDEAARALERVVEKIGEIAPVGEHTGFGASVGVSRARPADTVESVLERADEALYEAKRAGGRRIEISD